MKTLFIILNDCACPPAYAPLWFKLVVGGILIGGYLFLRWYSKQQKDDPWKTEQERRAKEFAQESNHWYLNITKQINNIPMDWEAREELQLEIKKAIGA